MFPASLAPMLLKMLLPKITDHIAKAFKVDQLLSYMELPNEADRRIDKLEEQIRMLANDQHPPAIDLEEWKEVKGIIKKLKNKKAFKSLG